MRAPILVCTALLATTAAAQVRDWTMPSGYLSQEADGYDRYFGAYASLRAMVMDGLRSQKFSLKELAYRPNYDNYALRPAVGRKWTNVTLRMGEGDMTVPTVHFSKVLRTSQTTVFSAAVAWPAINTIRATRPMPFSIRFPFVKPWVYTGKYDLCADYVFTGGTLANKQPWTSEEHSYRLDLAQNITSLQPVSAPGVQVGAEGCRDSLWTRPAELGTHELLWNPLASNEVVVSLDATFAGNSSVLLAAGVAGSVVGTAIPGVSCQRLYVDLQQTAVLILLPVYSGGVHLHARAPYRAAYVGNELWLQAAWLDTATGGLLLTPASRQGLFAPQNAGNHLEMVGQGGSTGATPRVGAPVCRFRQ